MQRYVQVSSAGYIKPADRKKVNPNFWFEFQNQNE